MSDFSSLDKEGTPKMEDVGAKPDQLRIALASGYIKMKKETLELIRKEQLKKGNVITLAEIAGIQGAKLTSSLIPLSHNPALTKVKVKIKILDTGISARSLVKTVGKAGVEMEALTAVTTALLAIFDLCKEVDSQMEISGIHLQRSHSEDLQR